MSELSNVPLLELRDVRMTYGRDPSVHALRGVALSIASGEFVAIEGPSGGGKSTLLNILGLLEKPSAGTYQVDGLDVLALSQGRLTSVRSAQFSFIFQNFHLLDRRPVVDSVEMGLLYQRAPWRRRRLAAMGALDRVGLAAQWNQRSSTLSGGQRQRVAIARALAAGSPIVLADEPTGNLDSENTRIVLDSLRELNASGVTVVIVTHDADIAAIAHRRVRIEDGFVVSDVHATGSAGLQVVGVPSVGAAITVARAPALALSRVARPSRLGFMDLIRDTVASVRSRRGRNAGLALAVAAAVGLAVGTAGLSTSSSAQVSSSFDARANRYVTITDSPSDEANGHTTGWSRASGEPLVNGLTGIAGVDAAAVLTDFDQVQVTSASWRPTSLVPTYAVIGQFALASEADITWADAGGQLSDGQVLVGSQLAANLELGPLEAHPVVLLNGKVFEVAGFINDSKRMPELTGSIVEGGSETSEIGDVGRTIVLLLTSSGAAQQVAAQAPLVVDPVNPELLTVSAPVDPRDLRVSIEADVGLTLEVLTAVALLAAITGLANAMVLAVVERRQEFGLRRATGARPIHIAALVLGESSIVGALGGAVGLLLGMTAVTAITIAQRWTPVMDLRLAPVALLGGIVVGAAGGLVAAAQAAKTQPSIALRQ